MPNKTGNVAYKEACISSEKSSSWTDIVAYLLTEECLENAVEGAICVSAETVALKVGVANSPNGQVTILSSKDLDALGAEVQAFIESMRKTLGTKKCSEIYGQQVVVQYFYQQRMYIDKLQEECYQYYAYFEVEGVEYLCQYSSNWTLPGKAVTALHNLPHTISEALSQEESEEQFLDMLDSIVQVVLTES